MVAIPNHHFFQWVNQLKDSGHEVYWFDVMDSGPKSHRIKDVEQIKGWKLRFDFPFRIGLKKRFPEIYNFIQKFNERKIDAAFKKVIRSINPDIIHCFEMQLSGFPILNIMQENDIPFIYSSWGSDMYYFEQRGISIEKVKLFLKRVDYLITDCERDYQLALKYGYSKTFLGVFPGNGGIEINTKHILDLEKRDIILLKGYQYDVGEAIQIVKAIELLSQKIKELQVVVYSADKEVEEYINSSKIFKEISFKVLPRHTHILNKDLLELMGKSIIHIGNNLSDGMPNTLLEAMGMGAFPIQSNPGEATAEVIQHGINGYLIENPLDHREIAVWIEKAIGDMMFRKEVQEYNTSFINKNYKRSILAPKIHAIYKNIVTNS